MILNLKISGIRLILTSLFFCSIAAAQTTFYDTPIKSHLINYQKQRVFILDSTVAWSSYSWWWPNALDSKEWLQCRVTPTIGLGIEVEIWVSNLKLLTTKCTPRLGVQYKF